MHDAVTATVDQRTMDNLRRNLADLVSVTGRSAADAVIYAAIKYAQSGAKRSIPSPKRRPIKRTWTARAVRGMPETGGKRYAFDVFRQNGPPQEVITNKANDFRREIANAGLARKSWGWMLYRLNGRGNGSASRTARGAVSTYKIGMTSGNPTIILQNNLGYLGKAFPGIEDESLAAANRGMDYTINRALDRAIRRAARGLS